MPDLNLTIVWCSNQRRSADFLTEILGLPAARRFMHFLVVEMSNGVSLDYYETDEPVVPQHYAFLVPDEEFDGIRARVRARASEIWADPARTRPDEHLLEVITRPYGDTAPADG